MRLEVGKKYKSANGETVEIVDATSSDFPFQGDFGFRYNINGVSTSFLTKDDLISEVSEPAAVETPLQVISFRDQLARDLLVAAAASGDEPVDEKTVNECFNVADAFMAEGKRRG
jgi:hypothetical protein